MKDHTQLGYQLWISACIRINEPDQELPMVDQDVPWKLTPWAHNVTTVDSLATSLTSVQSQSKRKELAFGKKDHMIKDCPIRKKKLVTKKPGQKCPFGHFMCQENIGTNDC